MKIINELPSAEELEQAVLGALLIEKDSYLDIASILSVNSFYNPKNAMVYDAISNMSIRNMPVDLYTVSVKLEGKVEPIYLANLTSKVGTASHIVAHAMIIQEKYIERCIFQMSLNINSIGSNKETDLSDKIASINQCMINLLDLTDNSDNNVKLFDVLKKGLEEIDENCERYKNGKTSGIDTGINKLTNVLGGGLHNSELYVIGARPGMGKTAALIMLAEKSARQDKNVQIYSIEMRDTEICNRMIVGGGGVGSYHLRNGNIDKEEWIRIMKNIASIESLPIWINDKPGLTIDDITINARKMHRRGMCDVIFIDYLQIISATTSKGRTRTDIIGEISRKSKKLAKELNVPVVLLSQLSRESAKSGNRIPQLTDLRDSGEIEQDADVVIFIHRPAYYGEKTYEVGNNFYDETKGLGFFIVAKNRHGKITQVPFSHNESMTAICNYEK